MSSKCMQNPMCFKGFKQILGGRNNKIIMIKKNKKSLILKKFLFLKENKLKNYKEFMFCKLLIDKKINLTPKAIKHYPKDLSSLYSFIKGKKIYNINKDYLEQSFFFLKSIQKIKFLFCKKFSKNSLAVDACQSLNDYIQTVEKKIANLILVTDNKKLKFFLEDQFIRKWKIAKIQFKKKYKKNLLKKILKKNMILSPSDFGFHNMIIKNSKIFFIDFEYCGLDDPKKLICDFICQPNLQLNLKQKKYFLTLFGRDSDFCYVPPILIEDLLLICRFKWCLIIFNDFLLEKNNLRKFSGFFSKNKLKKQLIVGIKYFQTYLGSSFNK